MSTILFLAGTFVLILVIASKLPGVEYLVKPVIDLLFYIVRLVLDNSLAWGIWLFKTLGRSHTELIQNLIYTASQIDPTVDLEK